MDILQLIPADKIAECGITLLAFVLGLFFPQIRFMIPLLMAKTAEPKKSDNG